MTDEEKYLLLKDLCARLPYGVICKTEKGNGHLCSINQTFFGIEYGVNISSLKRDYFDDINTDEQVVKPYLRPMSSMTDKQKKEYQYITERWMNDPAYSISDSIDWLNKHHFDYHELISMGLAIDASGLNIY